MDKRFAVLLLMVVMTCFAVPSKSFATAYTWSQSSVWAISETYQTIDITGTVSSSGFLEIGDYSSDQDGLWYATVMNLQFAINDAVGDVYSWNLNNISETYLAYVPPVPGGPLKEPDIHLYSNNEARFTDYGGAQHNVYSFVGNPGFPVAPFPPGDFTNINFFGNWTERPISVPEPSALLLLTAALTGLGVTGLFKRSG